MSNKGLCCMAAHANATAPWTCPCECHKRRETNRSDTRLEEIRQAARDKYYACGNYVEAQKDIEHLLRLVSKMQND